MAFVFGLRDTAQPLENVVLKNKIIMATVVTGTGKESGLVFDSCFKNDLRKVRIRNELQLFKYLFMKKFRTR